jgi:large subunit ribosomal protein L19
MEEKAQEFEFRVGDTITVSQKINEGKRERVIGFKGQLIKVRGRAGNRMITVRQTMGGVEVERIFSVDNPTISSIELVAKPKKTVRRARLMTVSPKK